MQKFYEDRRIYCYKCRKRTIFTQRDLKNNIGVESHCRECIGVWFEWQNRAVEREMEKWIDYNNQKFTNKPFISNHRV